MPKQYTRVDLNDIKESVARNKNTPAPRVVSVLVKRCKKPKPAAYLSVKCFYTAIIQLFSLSCIAVFKNTWSGMKTMTEIVAKSLRQFPIFLA